MESAVLEYVMGLAPKSFKQWSPTFSRVNTVNVVALVKEKEQYVFVYDDQSRAEALRTLGRFASRPGLSFTWYDAAVLSQKIRQEGEGCSSNDYSRMSYSEMKRRRFEIV